MGNCNILLVDDHDMVREGLASIIGENPNYHVVADSPGGEQALSILKKRNDIHLVSTDISMDGMDGIMLAGEINKKYPEVKVMALTMLKESVYIKRMFEAGAIGYVLKNSGRDELFQALDKVSKGEPYWSEEVADTLMKHIALKSKQSDKPLFKKDALSSRELEVLDLILREYDNQQIAQKLFISHRTVEVHKHNLLEKTGSKNLAGLALFAIKSGLFNID